MITLQLIIATSCILNLFIGLVVIVRKKTRSNISFAIFAFTTSAWNLTNVIYLFNLTLTNLRITYALGALVMSASLGWVVIYTKSNYRLAILSYFFGILNAIVCLSPLVIKEVTKFEITGQQLEFGPLYNLVSLWFLITLVLDGILLYSALKNDKSKPRRNQVRFIFLGVVLFGTSALLVSIFLPMMGINYLMMLDSPSALFFVSFAAYAIIKHRLMDIRALVIRSVVFSILIGIVATAYAGIIYFATQGYGRLIDRNVLFIVTGFILVFSFQPLRRFLEKSTDRIFFKDRYNFRELLREISDMLATKLTLDDLTEDTLLMLTQQMRINQAAIILLDNKQISDVKVFNCSRARSFWQKAASLTMGKDNVLVTDEFWEDSEERAMLRKIKIEVLVPLKNEEDFVGILALGEKRSGDMYTPEDLKLLEIIAPQTAIALQNAVLFKEKEQRIKELDALNKLALHVGSTLHLDKILDAVLVEAIEVTDAEAGSIMLTDEHGKTLSIKTARGISVELRRKKIKIGEGIAGTVAKTLQPLNIDGQNKQFKPFIKREEIASSVSVPLIVRDKLIGVLNVNRRKKRTPFTDENMHLMQSFAAQAAEAIDNANLYENLEKTFMETISALAAAVDAKDHYTYGHSEAVTRYSIAIAKELGQSQDEINKLEVAGKLHDIGKIGINENILNKPGKLSDEEFKLIQMHPKIGVDILKTVESLNDIIPLILYHHERIDGHGYPTGMPGNIIPLGAKILAVADSFDAMTSDRPYRKALPLKEAIKELDRCSGTQFDPQVVECFEKIIESGQFKKFSEAKKRHLKAIN